MTKKEFLLLLLSILFSISIALLVIRVFFPHLLQITVPQDLQLVQLDSTVPSFYSNIFRFEDYSAKQFILQDPITKHRAKPQLYRNFQMFGPHDILGFRNNNIPLATDIVIIGDSQTYGNNARLSGNWPNWLAQISEQLNLPLTQYSMAVGGWGSIQYYNMCLYASYFSPQMVLLAFYSGNDPIESFSMAYHNPHWQQFKINSKPGLKISDLPTINFPVPISEQWSVKLSNQLETTFAPQYRSINVMNHEVIDTAWEIMAQVALSCREILPKQIKLGIVLIPTKEFAYYPLVEQSNLVNKVYDQLVQDEKKRWQTLTQQLKNKAPEIILIDTQPGLSKSLLQGLELYPKDVDGHPLVDGYRIIATEVFNKIEQHYLPIPQGQQLVSWGENIYQWLFIQGHRYSEMSVLFKGLPNNPPKTLLSITQLRRLQPSNTK